MNMLLHYLELAFRLFNAKWRIAAVISAVLSVVIALVIYEFTSFSEIVIFLLAMLMWIALSLILIKIISNLHNRICRYEIAASIVDMRTESVETFGKGSQVYFEYISVEYEFNSQKYRRVIRLNRFLDVHSGQKLNLKICERYPGIYKFDINNYKNQK